MSSKYPTGGQAVVTLVMGVGALVGSGASFFLFRDGPRWVPVLFLAGFGVVFTWISIRGLFSPDFGEGTATTRQPTPEEMSGEIRDWENATRVKAMFILGGLLFVVGPFVGSIGPLREIAFFGRPLTFWLPLSAFVVWGIPIYRLGNRMYDDR